MINDIEQFFINGCGRCKRFATADCSARKWAAGLLGLRQLCLGMGLNETLKWGHPCYTHAGRNIVVIGAFRNDFRLTFFNASLLNDSAGLLQKRGPNTKHPDMIAFRDNAGVAPLETEIRAVLTQAMELAEAGIRPTKEPEALELPDELTDALDADPELAEAFRKLTPGRQKSYVILLNAAKKPETRRTRIEKFRPRVLLGKGAQEQ